MAKSNSKREEKIRKQRGQLARNLGARGELLRCSLLERFTVCARPGCRCGKGKKHGPYLYVSVFDGKQSRQVYVPQSMEREVRAWAANNQSLAETVARISRLSVEVIKLRHKRKGHKGLKGLGGNESVPYYC